MAKITLRTLAKTCGISSATVSRALSGHPNVSQEVRDRVQTLAREHGYQRNQLLSGVMARVRTARTQHFVGNLAIVHVPSAEQPTLLPMQRRMIEGANARARELGYQIGVFSLGSTLKSQASLARMLAARGVMGLIFLHSNSNERIATFPAQDFAVVQVDYDSPTVLHHTISLDHHFTLIGALSRLRGLGYARIGLFIESHKDDRLFNKWSAAFRSFQENQAGIGHVPVLRAKTVKREIFLPWFKKSRPDLIIGHVDRATEWLNQAGIKVPKDVAFFNLNWNERTLPCAGLDLRPELHGAVAVDTISALTQRNERGSPADPQTVMFKGKWVDGPTLGASAP